MLRQLSIVVEAAIVSTEHLLPILRLSEPPRVYRARITSTEQCARAATPEETLPIKKRSIPLTPLDPRKMQNDQILLGVIFRSL
jgi:hypothetical protein